MSFNDLVGTMNRIHEHHINSAQDLIYKFMPPTPQYSWSLLNEAAGNEIWVKHENHTPTGAFKIRGGIVYLNNHKKEAEDFISATRGNHGQSIAFASRIFGRKAHIFVPECNCPDKNAAMEAFGADVFKSGKSFDEAKANCARHSREHNYHFVPSYHDDLVIGVATYAYEFMKSVENLDVIYVPIGLGSGICANIMVRDMLGLKTKIIGVVAEKANAYEQSFKAGKIIPTKTTDTFADGLAVGTPHDEAFEIIKNGAEDVVSVSETEIADAIRLYFSTTHNIAEGAGAAPLAAAIKHKNQNKGKKCGVILSGGNINKDIYTNILNHNFH